MNSSLPITIRSASEMARGSTTWTMPSSLYSIRKSLSDATALPEGEKRFVGWAPTVSNTPSTDEGLRQTLVRGHFIANFNRRLSKVMPAVGLAALLTHAGYSAGSLENH